MLYGDATVGKENGVERLNISFCSGSSGYDWKTFHKTQDKTSNLAQWLKEHFNGMNGLLDNFKMRHNLV
jgi:hypothetical protein